jgi:phosphatidylinositol alpha-mannosyltransferase
MKIAIVCPYNLEIHGGVQEHVMAEALELRKRGHKVVVVTPKPRRRKTPADKGIYYIGQSARIPTPGSTSSDVSAAIDNSSIDEFYETFQPDLVHVHEPVVPFMARQVIAEATCPVVGTYHAARPENAMGRSLITSAMPYTRTITKQLTAITIVSRAAMMLLQDSMNSPQIIPNGVDLKTYKPLKVARDENNVLYVGRLEKRKGVYQLLDGFYVLRQINPKANLDIVGGGPLWKKLQARVIELGLSGAVTFHGFVSAAEKRRLMSKCGVFVSLALYGESFGIVLVEAMAMGAPTVAGNNEGYASVLSGRGQLSLVDPYDSVEVANRLNLLMQDKSLANLWRQWARQSVKQYDWPRVVDKYEALFNSLVR